MSDSTKAFLQRWFVTSLGVLVAAGLIDKVHADGIIPLLVASLLLGILNAFLRPILLIATIPLGRLSVPRDVARAAVFLASEEAEFITGVEFPVDGGRTI